MKLFNVKFYSFISNKERFTTVSEARVAVRFLTAAGAVVNLIRSESAPVRFFSTLSAAIFTL